MLRKTFVATSAVLVLLLGAVMPASANVQADPAISGSGVIGSCVSEHAGVGSSLNIVVELAVEAPTATGLTARCHLDQGTRSGHVNGVSALGTATGAGVFTGWALAPYTLCIEIHAVFATGGTYDKLCH